MNLRNINKGYFKLDGAIYKLNLNDEYRAATGSPLYMSVNTRPDKLLMLVFLVKTLAVQPTVGLG